MTGAVFGVELLASKRMRKSFGIWPSADHALAASNRFCSRFTAVLFALLMALASHCPGADSVPPSTPGNLRAAELSDTGALLTWNPATDDTAVAGYEVFRDGLSLGKVAVTNFTDNGPLDRYASYEYAVSAYDAAGNTSALTAPLVFAYHRSPFRVAWTNSPFPSVTDRSGLAGGPAIDYVVATNGHLYANGQPFRIFGVNCVFDAAFPAHDMAEKVAARLARAGVNCVRFHHMDSNLKPKGIFVNVATNSPDYRRTLDPGQLEKMDYFIAQLKARGIYANLNLHVGRYYPNYPTNGITKYFKGLDIYVPGLIDLQKEYARDLLTHVNAYTGLPYTQDPAVAIIEINNENGLIHEWHAGEFAPTLEPIYLNELSNQWNVWLTNRYPTTLALSNAWAPATGSPYGAELLTNGFFTNSLASWTLAVSNPAVATYSFLTNGVPDAANALELNVTTAGASSDVRLWQGGSRLSNGLPYTIKFRARAETNRTVAVSFVQNYAPYQTLATASFNLTTQWQEFKVILTPTASDTNARLELSGLGQPAGRVWFASLSAKTGNTILGMAAASAEQSVGPELLANTNFAAGFVSPWVFQVKAPAGGTYRLVTNGAPSGNTALEISVTTNDSTGGFVQFYQNGLRLTNAQPYTIRFRAKTEIARTISVGFLQTISPWANRGSVAVTIDTNWQDYAVVVVANADEPNARLNLTSLGDSVARMWFADFSLKVGAATTGLLTNETLGTVNLIRKDQYGTRTRALQRDWMQFMWDTERNYWNGMRDYVRNTLGARALVVGTQTSYSPSLIQADMDIVDSHAYWHHPSFPGVPWDTQNWYTINEPMAGFPGSSTLSGLAPGRITGKPFICTEYNHPAPITYSTETFPVATTYAALQGWDGLFAYNFLDDTNYNNGYFDSYFNSGVHIGKMIHYPLAASILRRADVAPAANENRVAVPTDMALMIIGQTDTTIGVSDFGLDAMQTYAQRLSLATGTVFQTSTVLRDTNQPVIASDTAQLAWDTAKRILTVRAPLSKALIGHANQQTFDLGDGVVVTPGSTMQGTNWAAIALLVAEGGGFQSAGTRVLLTAAGYVDNHRMQWNAGMGPTNATSSINANWGQAPSLIECVPATITLPMSASQVAVYALNEKGERQAIVPVSNVGGQATFQLTRDYATPWFELTLGLATNYAPILDPIPDSTVNVGSTLLITNVATDLDVVPQVLTFSLLTAPANAAIDPATGLFSFTPVEAQSATTNFVTVKVADNGSPSLSATQSFWVTVPHLASSAMTWAGTSTNWDLSLTADWLHNGSATVFYNGDSVSFDDTGAARTNVYLPDILTPAAVTIASTANYTFQGPGRITGAASLRKLGAGTLTLSTTNDFSGGVAIGAGAVRAMNNFALGTSPTVVSNGGQLQIGAPFPLMLPVTIAGSGPDGNGAIYHLRAANGAAYLGGPITLSAHARINTDTNTLYITNGINAAGYTITLGGSNNMTLGSSANGLGISGAGSVLVKDGSGTVYLRANSTYDGGTILNNGTFICDSNFPGLFGFGKITINAGTLRPNYYSTNGGDRLVTNAVDIGGSCSFGANGVAYGQLTFAGPWTLLTSNRTLTAYSPVTIASPIGDAGKAYGFTKAGYSTNTLTLAAANTYSGPTTNSAGILALGPNGSLSNSPLIFVTGNSIFDVSDVANGFVVASNQTLMGYGAVSGPTRLGPGAFLTTGRTNGTLTFTNDLSFDTGAVALLKISRTNLIQNSDRFVCYGALNYGGALVVSNTGPALAPGDTFTLFTATSYAGNFSSCQLPALASNAWGWNVNQLSIDGTIQVGALPLITNQPQSQLVQLGSNATFAVAATNALGYQWQKLIASNQWAALPAGTNSQLLLTNCQVADADAYQCLVSNLYGLVASSNALLAVNQPPAPPSPILARYPAGGVKTAATNFLGPDPEGDLVTLSSVGPASAQGGTVLQSGAWVFYAPPPGFTNADSFAFTLSDSRGGRAIGTALVTLKATAITLDALRITNLGTNRVSIEFQGVPGLVYTVQCASRLEPANWQALGTVTADATGTCQLQDTSTNAPQRIYRALWP